MKKLTFQYGPPEELEKNRALEFLSLSPTEKFWSLMNLIEISFIIKENAKSIKDKYKTQNE